MSAFSPELQSALAHLTEVGKQTDNRLDDLEESIQTLREDVGHDVRELRLQFNEATTEIEKTPTKPQYDKLYPALVAAQLEIKNADANVENEFLKSRYADLGSVMDAVREPLAKNGLTIIQLTATIEEVKTVEQNPDAIGIKTVLAHESGQNITDIIAMVAPNNDPQGIGSCRTYMRRYGVLGICAIAGAVDDDAEGTKVDPDDYERLTPEQIDEILVLADKHFKQDADAKVNRMLDKAFQVTAVGDIPSAHFDSAINLLNNQAKREKAQAKKPKPDTTESKAEPGADG